MPCGATDTPAGRAGSIRRRRGPSCPWLQTNRRRRASTGVAAPSRPNPPAGAAVSVFEVISLKNFRSDNVTTPNPGRRRSMKPPNMSFVIGCPVRAASRVADTVCAAAVAAKRTMIIETRNNCLPVCMSVLQSNRAPAAVSRNRAPCCFLVRCPSAGRCARFKLNS